MIRMVREQLELTREDLSFYLRISPDMIKSIEMGRRQSPFDGMAAVVTLYQLMKDVQTKGHVSDPGPPANAQVRHLKRFYRQCSRRLDKCTDKLKKAQKSYASACFSLGVYQLLAQSLTPARSEDDSARLKWAQWKIKETMQRIQDNNAAVQDILTAEIAGLKGTMHALEGSDLFPFKDAK